MSRFRTRDNYVSQKGFANLPGVGGIVLGESQPRGSLESGSTSSRVSGVSSQRGSKLQEGDLITGTINLVHERAYMLLAIRDEGRAEEKKAMERYIVSLKIVPPFYREVWKLDHDSNTTWLSLDFHRHHDTYATFLIAPSLGDSFSIWEKLRQDNTRRADIIKRGETDPGRDDNADWFEGTKGEYELAILRPSHFSLDNSPVVIKHPNTGNFTLFYASEYKDGLLREGSSTGPPLPPFRSRGSIDRKIPLNPILVNYAAIIRLRRLIRQNPMWGFTLAPRAIDILQGVVKLHAAVLWDPQGLHREQLCVEVPGSQPPSFYNLEEWPYARASTTQPGSSFLGPNPGIRTDVPATALDRAFALMEAGFEELPDLDDDDDSHHRPDLPSDLGVMMPQEKMERFLTEF